MGPGRGHGWWTTKWLSEKMEGRAGAEQGCGRRSHRQETLAASASGAGRLRRFGRSADTARLGGTRTSFCICTCPVPAAGRPRVIMPTRTTNCGGHQSRPCKGSKETSKHAVKAWSARHQSSHGLVPLWSQAANLCPDAEGSRGDSNGVVAPRCLNDMVLLVNACVGASVEPSHLGF